MPLDVAEGLAQRRGDAEKVGLSIINIESPIGDPVHGCPNSRFRVALSVSAPLRDIPAARIHLLSTFRFTLLSLNDFDYQAGASEIDDFFDWLCTRFVPAPAGG